MGVRHDEGVARHQLSQVAQASPGEGGAIWHCCAEREDTRVVPQGDGIQLLTALNRDRLEIQPLPGLYRVVVKHRGACRVLRIRGDTALNPIRRGQLASTSYYRGRYNLSTDVFGLIHFRTAHAWLSAMTCSKRWTGRPLSGRGAYTAVAHTCHCTGRPVSACRMDYGALDSQI